MADYHWEEYFFVLENLKHWHWRWNFCWTNKGSLEVKGMLMLLIAAAKEEQVSKESSGEEVGIQLMTLQGEEVVRIARLRGV